MRVNSKFVLLLVLLFLLYILLFSSTNEESTINYRELLPANKIKEFLQANYYQGTWRLSDAENPAHARLQGFEGKFRFAVATHALGDRSIIFDDSKQEKTTPDDSKGEKSQPGWQVFMLLFDSKYIDRHLYRFVLKDGQVDRFNGSTVDLIFPPNKYQMVEMDKFSIKNRQECQMTFSIRFFANTSNIDLAIAYKDLSGELTIESPGGCFPSIHGGFQIDHRDFKMKLFNFSSFVIATAILILFSAIFTYNGIVTHQYDINQYSIATLVIIMVQDVFATFFLIYLGLNNQQLFHLYFTPALWYFIIFAILDFRLLTLLWKLQNERILSNLEPSRLRAKLLCFNLKAYGSICIGLFAFKFVVTSRHFMYLAALGSLIQICQIAYKQVNRKFDFYFNVIFVNCRLLILLYYRGCPLNVEEFEPYLTESLALVGIIAVLLLALRYQSIHGGRSILPSFFQPARFDYFVKYDPETAALALGTANRTSDSEAERTQETTVTQDEQTCPICLESIFSETSEQLLDNLRRSPYFRSLGGRRQEYMRAPCGHRFHVVCLVNWMHFKLECPSCRQPLPPV